MDVVFFPVKNGREESLNSDTNFFYTFHLIAKPMIKLTIIIYFHHLYAKEESVQSYFFFFRSRYTYLIKLLQSKYYYIKQFTHSSLLCKCESDFVKMYTVKTTTLIMCTIFYWKMFHVKFINIFFKTRRMN